MATANHLNSHHAERHSYPADKLIPKGVFKSMRNQPCRKDYKKMHTKKQRVFNKKLTKLFH